MVSFRYPTELARDQLFVTIVRAPQGEAPLWVREAWVGLRVPLAVPNAARWISTGVLSSPRSLVGRAVAIAFGRTKRVTGYAVNARTAVDLLADHDPKAAAWWREHVPHLLHGDRCFAFETAACAPEDGKPTLH